MAWKISWSSGAFAFLSRMEKKDATRVNDKLEEASKNPQHYFVRLGGQDEYRLRIGDYRLVALLLHNTETIYVENLDHRKKVYDRKN